MPTALLILYAFTFVSGIQQDLKNEKKVGRNIMYSAFYIPTFLYSIFLLSLINCELTNNINSPTNLTITKKETRIYKGQTTHYLTGVSIKSDDKFEYHFEVSQDRWETVSEGQSILIEIQNGLLGVRWKKK